MAASQTFLSRGLFLMQSCFGNSLFRLFIIDHFSLEVEKEKALGLNLFRQKLLNKIVCS